MEHLTIDWGLTNRALAQKYRRYSAIDFALERKRRGIPNWGEYRLTQAEIDWAKESDEDIAKKTGLHLSTVWGQRKRLGMPAYKGRKKRPSDYNWDHVDWSKVSGPTDLARQVGCSRQRAHQVLAERKKKKRSRSTGASKSKR